MELPKNKPAVNGKYRTKQSIQNAIYKLLLKGEVEGRYSDDHWAGIKKLLGILEANGIDVTSTSTAYEGHGEVNGSSLPTRKVYRFELKAVDKQGIPVTMNMKVTCSFIGKTGTMIDNQYELLYYFT